MADKNALIDGQHRLGWLIDGLADTPMVSCTLRRIDDRIELLVPWSDHKSPYWRWFGGEVTHYGDDPDKTGFNYAPPNVLWFNDEKGCVTLVGCRVRGHNEQLGGPGVGRIGVRRAVFGGRQFIDYARIHGFRSVIPGMSQWLHLRSMSEDAEYDDDQRLQSVTLTLKSPDPVPLHRNLNLIARPSFHYELSAHGDTTEIRERVLIETHGSDLAEWADHELMHIQIAELVGLAAWAPFNVSETTAQRLDDPIRVLFGGPVGDRWASVIRTDSRQYPLKDGHIQFLFTFQHIGPQGIEKWIDLREAFARGIGSILDLHRREPTPIEIQVSQAGIGLDGIGYLLALKGGLSERDANREIHKDRLKRVYDDLVVPLPFLVEPWATRAADAYNATKHANREMPAFEELVEVRRMLQIVFRVWVAGRIGVPPATLATRLLNDHMSRPTQFE